MSERLPGRDARHAYNDLRDRLLWSLDYDVTQLRREIATAARDHVNPRIIDNLNGAIAASTYALREIEPVAAAAAENETHFLVYNYLNRHR